MNKLKEPNTVVAERPMTFKNTRCSCCKKQFRHEKEWYEHCYTIHMGYVPLERLSLEEDAA